MREPSNHVPRRDRSQGLGYGLVERLPCTLPSFPHQVLYLRERLFDEPTTVRLYTPASSSGHKIIASLRFDPLPMSMVSAG